MNLTTTERKRLAKEMRGLAMECLTNGPQMIDQWCGCAIGISMHRAGLWSNDYCYSTEYEEAEELAQEIDDLMNTTGANADGVVSEAVRERIWRGNPTAVVFPLLALADEVEQP